MIDEETLVLCASGTGLIREEVWIDGAGEVGRYNLAFINHFMTREDNGRVLMTMLMGSHTGIFTERWRRQNLRAMTSCSNAFSAR
jgi:hypothetical protein